MVIPEPTILDTEKGCLDVSKRKEPVKGILR
jgi:hypothetical protein